MFSSRIGQTCTLAFPLSYTGSMQPSFPMEGLPLATSLSLPCQAKVIVISYRLLFPTSASHPKTDARIFLRHSEVDPSQAKLVLFWPKSTRFCVLGHFTSQNRLLIEYSDVTNAISVQRNGGKCQKRNCPSSPRF